MKTRSTDSRYIKKALIHDASVPVGTAAAVHVECECSTAVPITQSVNMCPKCYTTYSAAGYIIEGNY